MKITEEKIASDICCMTCGCNKFKLGMQDHRGNPVKIAKGFVSLHVQDIHIKTVEEDTLCIMCVECGETHKIRLLGD